MTLIDIVQVFEDTRSLGEIARQAGVSIDEARAVCAALSHVPIRQAIRICVASESERVRRVNRVTRRSSR